MNRSLSFIVSATGGRLAGPDMTFGAVSIDSRTLNRGDLFVAIRGERFDGHDFAAAAVERGAVAAVVARELELPVPQVIVDDTLRALADAAGAWRGQFTIPVAGVAGSNGKTTSKELLAAILARRGETLATRGNLNNHIGVPLTLLGLEARHRAAVIEIGANHPGEVAALAGLARPTVGLVTNAGAEHLEGFGSLEGVARAEGELFASLGPAATAVINADDEFASLWREQAAAGSVLTFSVEGAADFVAADLQLGIDGQGWASRFVLNTPAGSAPVRLSLPGRHNVRNAAGAAAAAWACGATLEQIVAGLATVQPVRGRLQLKAARHGAWLIDDSYNANPTSALAGLEVLAGLQGERWLVLGEMAELGAHTASGHAEVGRAARSLGVARLFATGAGTQHAVEAFGRGAEWHAGLDSLLAAVDASLRPGVAVLVKGSRVNRLERAVDALSEPGRAVSNGH